MSSVITRVFRSGNSQAVRIPAEFRLDTDRVSISLNEHGDLVIRPIRTTRGAALLKVLQDLHETDKAFVDALQAEASTRQPSQDREAF